jgi:hypothetical protein
VRTGAGKDKVDARKGGFGGGGTFSLGGQNDVAFGFGNITLNGQVGRDKLFLPGNASDYTTSAISGGTQFTRLGVTLRALNFESISFLG